MSLTISQVHPVFVGEVTGVDLTKPLSAEVAARIEAAMDEHAVLVFHDQAISDEQQQAFSQNFGELENAKGGNVTKPQDRRLQVGMNDVSNLGKDNKPLPRDSRQRLFNLGNRLWHSDSSFRAIPAKYSLLSARVIPDAGGNTEFADMRAAYDDLDDKTKAELEGLICEHSLMHSRGALGFEVTDEERNVTFKPVLQSLIRVHQASKRKSLYLSSHIGEIHGMPRPEALMLLRELVEHATQPKYVYAHKWRQHDLVMWDNRCTMHRVRSFDETQPRDMRRTTVAGTEMTAEQELAA
ncbi:MAG: TauD/TfdA family dioxygenase [Pseudomonadota bacterium]